MNVLDAALYSILTGDTGVGGVANPSTGATGGFHQLTAPQGTAPPYIVFQEMTDVSVYTFGALAADHFFHQIKAFAVDDPNGTFSGQAKSGDLADRLKVLLTEIPVTANVSGKSVLYCRFNHSTPPMKEWDDANNRFVYSKGGIYEIWLS